MLFRSVRREAEPGCPSQDPVENVTDWTKVVLVIAGGEQPGYRLARPDGACETKVVEFVVAEIALICCSIADQKKGGDNDQQKNRLVSAKLFPHSAYCTTRHRSRNRGTRNNYNEVA